MEFFRKQVAHIERANLIQGNASEECLSLTTTTQQQHIKERIQEKPFVKQKEQIQVIKKVPFKIRKAKAKSFIVKKYDPANPSQSLTIEKADSRDNTPNSAKDSTTKSYMAPPRTYILPKPFTSGITEKHHTYLLPKPTTQEQTYTTTVIPVASKPPTPQTTSITVPVYSKTSLYRKKAQASSGSYTPKYKARKAPNKCSKCGQPKLLDTGHKGFRGYSYCPASEKRTYEEWKESLPKKK